MALTLAATGLARQAQAQTAERKLMVLGDSLSAEYGLPRGKGWVTLLGQRLAKRQPPWQVVNASISGDTTSGGRSRLPALLRQHQPRLLIIELGGNDALRGLPVRMTQDNLLEMTRSAQAVGAKVLLLGMRMPPNYGPDYTNAFFAAFEIVARAHDAVHLPFLLEPLGLDRRHFQADNLHPTAEAQPLLAEHVWDALGPMLEH